MKKTLDNILTLGYIVSMRMIEEIKNSGNNYDSGDCGDLVRSVYEKNKSVKAHGVVAYDGELVHIIGELDGRFFDGQGFRPIEDIAEEWAYDRPVDQVQIVAVELVDNNYVYGDQSLTANIIEI